MSGIKKLVGFSIVALIGAGFFVGSGTYNIAANDKHWNITENLLTLVRDNSIRVRAQDIVAPDITDAKRIERGAANYEAMCQQCHLAPGVDSSELYEGLYPKPPVLYKDADIANSPNDAFWVIKNGIKMTGMPAWGKNNSDEQIWDMIALVSALDKMGADQYKKLAKSGSHGHKGDETDKHAEDQSDKHMDDEADEHAEGGSEKHMDDEPAANNAVH